MESKYPQWQSVYYYFEIWSKTGLWDELLSVMVKVEREKEDREALPSRLTIDSQSNKVSSFIDEQTVGIDVNKKIKGRKRHIVVDSLGLPIVVYISKANVHDSRGGINLLWLIEPYSERLELIVGDNAYG